jgi:sugar phosphate isomerase/epimerase
MPTNTARPSLAAFPKAWMDDLTLTGKMSLRQWIDIASSLKVDGVELYFDFLDLKEAATWPATRRMIEDAGLTMPMLCVSPDFTHPDPAFRQKQIDQQKRMIDMTATLGGKYCRVLSGQRRPEVSRQDGIRHAADSIKACLPHARDHGVILILENHYKDNYWQYPEFAQKTDVFCELVDQIQESNFGVNYDPSNTILAGEDPLPRHRHHRRSSQGRRQRWLRQAPEARRDRQRHERLRRHLQHPQSRRLRAWYFAKFTRLDQHRRRRGRPRSTAAFRRVSTGKDRPILVLIPSASMALESTHEDHAAGPTCPDH